MTDIELKPCPFCGGTNVKFEYITNDEGDAVGGAIECYDCLIVFSQREAICENDVIEAWNRRVKND